MIDPQKQAVYHPKDPTDSFKASIMSTRSMDTHKLTTSRNFTVVVPSTVITGSENLV
jgi:hypothetical protein